MNDENQKYVYIALIYIPSAVGAFTKFTTGYGYSHATFSFAENFEIFWGGKLLYMKKDFRNCNNY